MAGRTNSEHDPRYPALQDNSQPMDHTPAGPELPQTRLRPADPRRHNRGVVPYSMTAFPLAGSPRAAISWMRLTSSRWKEAFTSCGMTMLKVLIAARNGYEFAPFPGVGQP